VLEKEDGGRVSVEGEIEVEAAIEEADCAVAVADHYLASSA